MDGFLLKMEEIKGLNAAGEEVLYIFSPRFLVVSDRRVNPFPPTPSLSEEMHRSL